jgi:hypothetical protein
MKNIPIVDCPRCGRIILYSSNPADKKLYKTELAAEDYVGRFAQCNKCKPGTGYIKQLSPNYWQGRCTPTVDGKRTAYNIYAPTEAGMRGKARRAYKKHQGRARAEYKLIISKRLTVAHRP